jgi:hypothetical protein
VLVQLALHANKISMHRKRDRDSDRQNKASHIHYRLHRALSILISLWRT